MGANGVSKSQVSRLSLEIDKQVSVFRAQPGVEYIPNCPLHGTSILSGRGSQPQELGHIDSWGNIKEPLINLHVVVRGH